MNEDRKISTIGDGDRHIQRIKVQFLKYWPSQGLREAWRSYVFGIQDDWMSALYIAVKLLEKANE